MSSGAHPDAEDAASSGPRQAVAPGRDGGEGKSGVAGGGLYRALFALVLARLPPEGAHRLAALTLRAAVRTPGCKRLLARHLGPRDPVLEVRALGLTFPSPLGVAAGVDKDGSWFEGLGHLGFGFVEVGTVTARAQRGNPKPRVFRLRRDRALLNRMGFPNPGARALAARLERRRGREPIVGVNVGKGIATPIELAGEDYRAAVREVAPACDYLVLNVSSPNTPGLGELQAVELLRPLIAGVRREVAERAPGVPLLVKIGPDISEARIDAVADLALELGLAGIVAVNTTADRDGLADADAVARVQGGGISGPPLRARAVEVLERLYGRVGERLVLISVGGVETAADAWERIVAGATLVQAYTGFVYGGPGWPARVNAELARRTREAGPGSIQEIVGLAVRPGHGKIKTPANAPSHRTGAST
ncbi:MAG TPA: quinone-dependent dihydroorotate dehydrogenase [Solirubrobacteraceae bacterium]